MDINLIVYLVTTLVTYFLGWLSKKLKWNEEVPIPIQNIIVGALAFVVCWLVGQDMSNPQVIIQAIITAMSGVGTATIVYDTKKQIKEKK